VKNQNAKKELKIKLRREFRKKREFDYPKVNKMILGRVKEFLGTELEKNNRDHICIYWPLKDEVDLRSLRRLYGNKLALPAIRRSKILTYHRWESDNLKPDLVGIPAPTIKEELKPKDIRLILVPALAIDQKGFRLGYGGGFCDRLIANKEWAQIPSFVVLPHACIFSEFLPIEDWDIPFDGWITEHGKYKSR